MKNYGIFAAGLAALLLLAATANAGTTTVTFQDPAGTPGSDDYDLYYGAQRVSSPTYNGASDSIMLSLPSSPASYDQSLIRVIPSNVMPADPTLNNLSANVMAYVPSTSGANIAPYIYFGVTLSGDAWGSADEALIIAFNTASTPTNQWYQSSLNTSTLVHVEDDRGNLGTTQFSASYGQDMGTLGDLEAMSVSGGSTTWGDLVVQRVYVSAGVWPGVTNYTGYVDDFTLTTTATPEPMSMIFFGTGLVGIGGYMARRRMARTA